MADPAEQLAFDLSDKHADPELAVATFARSLKRGLPLKRPLDFSDPKVDPEELLGEYARSLP